MTRLVHNSEIAALFETYADLLEIEGANRFRVRAYRNAARVIANLAEEAASWVVDGRDLRDLPGIGDDLAGKIEEIVRTGRLAALDALAARIPQGLAALVKLPGIGPKRARAIHDKLQVKNVEDLAAQIRAGKADAVPGLGKTTLARLLKTIEQHETMPRRFRLADAERIAEPLCRYLGKLPGVETAIIAGSYRRRKDTVGDIDILATGAASNAGAIMRGFAAYPDVVRVLASGETRSSVVLIGGMQTDLRFVAPESLGAALLYFTGSKDHNIALRTLAQKAGLKINEYGVFRGQQSLAGRSEEDIYRLLDLAYIEPELRENRGEIEAAANRRLPRLITLDDIRGDLHVHTAASDGTASIAEMAEAAVARGYHYLAITDHSKRVSVAHGLDEARLNTQVDDIDRLAARFEKLRILKSCEVDILSDGKLDIADSTLRRLDFVYGAVHYNFSLVRDKQTERIIKAMDNPYLTILAHPTGRIINRREPYDVDIERVLRAAAERGIAVEVNSQPDRLDLNDIHCRMAKDLGVKIAISSDAHATDGLDVMRHGVDQARRGWLEPKDVINTLGLRELEAFFKSRRR